MARFGVIQEREKWDQLYFSKAVKPKQNRPSPGNFYFPCTFPKIGLF